MAQTATQARKARIGTAFGAAAGGYQDHAGVQKLAAHVVAELAEQAAAVAVMGPAPRILEIGCGTGLLTRGLQMRWPAAPIIATDLSAQMVAQAAGDGGTGATFLTMDGEQPHFDGPWFDLIVSSLAFQWFGDLPGAIGRLVSLLRPGGSLIFSTMGARSFAAWRTAHRDCGVEAGIAAYPTLDQLRAMLADHSDAYAFDEEYPLHCSDARGLLRHLKGIGAVVPVDGRDPVSPATLRAVMRRFDEGGARDGYHVLFGRVTRVPV